MDVSISTALKSPVFQQQTKKQKIQRYHDLIKYDDWEGAQILYDELIEEGITENEIQGYNHVKVVDKTDHKPKPKPKNKQTFKQMFDAAKLYVRVGDDYVRVIQRIDGNGYYLKSINKATILDDHDRPILQLIPKYEDWIMKPDNVSFAQTIGQFYNLYQPFPHKPKPGEWRKIKAFLKHIFGDQYELGLDYFTILYLHPDKRLPVLVLVSKERETGKTTFINLLKLIFGANVVFIQSSDLEQSFNWHYATANIICIDEAFIDKKPAFEKLKMLATAKNLPINAKYVKQTMIEFFGKIVICANDELDVIKIDQEETRYWVRKVSKPDADNVGLLDEMKAEIPAFLNYLESRPMETSKAESRLYLSIDKYKTEALELIRENSRSWLYKELKELITSWFLEYDAVMELYADPTDIKNKFFEKNNQVQIFYIRKVLKDEFKLLPNKPDYYRPFSNELRKKARAYCFNRKMFITDETAEIPENKTVECEITENINHDIPY